MENLDQTSLRLAILTLNSVLTFLIFSLYRTFQTGQETFLCRFHLKQEKSILDFEMLLAFLLFNFLGFTLILISNILSIGVISIMAYLAWILASISISLVFVRWWIGTR